MKKVLAIILSIAMVAMALPFSFGVTAADGDNKMLFAVTDDADGKLHYNGKSGISGLGYTNTGLLKQANGKDFTTGDGSAYLFTDEIDDETMWKIDFNVNAETGGHAKSNGGYTEIYPFYSSLT
ncbi:MAG: hypothetical protein U0K93_02525, partial [Acutalibacteraceae bacterium]|nr:hypothetical protein [Acutalibacteraceae bacterium]